MTPSTRLCVTGYGVVAPSGNDIASFDAALFGGRSAVRAEQVALPGLDAAWIPLARCSFDASAQPSPSRLPLDRGTAMALAAAESAARAAGIAGGVPDALRLGVYWGSGMGGASSFDATCHALYAEQRRTRPTSVVTTMPNAPVAELALRFGARGAAIGYACACASAAVAIGEAMRALRDGRLDIAIVGGSEALLSTAVISAWHAMRVLAPAAGADAGRACRPFSADRAGFALGEGAAALVIETAEHARARGARWHAVLSGYGSSCDAIHVTNPDPGGQMRAMQAALRDAGLSAGEIGHVNAHGTATLAGDAAEAESLCGVFGSSDGPAVTASKAIFGHLLGAGGALELVAALRALEHGAAPPTAHVKQLAADFQIDLVRDASRPLPGLRHVMSNSFAFGGTNAVLVASRDDGAR